MQKIFENMSIFKLIIVLILFSFLMNFLISQIVIFSFQKNAFEYNFVNIENPFISYFIRIIIAPIIETFVFQFLIIELLIVLIKKINDDLVFLPVIFSALFFALNHSANFYYFFVSLIMGILWALIYLFGRYRKNITGYLLAAIVHIGTNMLSVIYNETLI